MMEAFARLLHEGIGLDPASIGIASIERAVQQRIAACQCAGPQSYMEHLRARPDEMQALVETVVVPETWFFRDPKAFALVAEHTQRSASLEKLNFLCVPCSTGEEPYSLAMALLDAHVPPSRFHIDAIDVSERVLTHARRGIYGRNSFRGRDLEFRDRYFLQTADGCVLDPAVRQLVNFRRGNLLETGSISRGGNYDAIFCRNLLIYFDAATQHRAISNLERLLTPQGIFCVGPAETGLLAPYEFTHTRIPLTFAFRQGRPAPVSPPLPKPMARHAPLAPLPDLPPRKPTAAILPPPPAAPAPDLAEAARLADEGRLGEVATICHASLRHAGASAQAYYLLGLVSDATGRVDEAAAYYRKTLYLNPQHHDALLHYSLLTDLRGDANAAAALRQRARRSSDKIA